MGTKKTFVGQIGLKNGKAYPCAFIKDDKGREVPFNPKYGKRKLPVEYIGHREFELANGYSYVEHYCLMLMKDFVQDNLIPWDINPRDAIYITQRYALINVIEENPYRLQNSFGVNIVAKSAKYERHFITMDIPEPSVLTKKKYGVLNGNNLAQSITSAVEAINQGKVEYAYKDEMGKIYVPITIVVFSEDTPIDEITAYCAAKNFTVPQTDVALATMRGDFDKFIYDSIEHGIEYKFGEAQTDIEYRKMIDNIDKMSDEDDNLERFMGSRVTLTEYFKFQSIIHLTVMGCLKYNNEMQHHLEDKKSSFYSKEELSERRKSIRRNFVKPIMSYSRNKFNAAKEVLNSVRREIPSQFNAVQNEELMHDFFFNAYDTVRTFDFSKYFKERQESMEKLSFGKLSENTLSPFVREQCYYKIPVYMMNFVAYIYGCLCNFTEDEVTKEGKVVMTIDFKSFWNDNYLFFMDKILECRERNKDLDVYSFANNSLDSSVNLWNQIRDFCKDNYKSYTNIRRVA